MKFRPALARRAPALHIYEIQFYKSGGFLGDRQHLISY